MKCLFLFSLLIISCATKQNVGVLNDNKMNTIVCPEDGICDLEILSNQSLSLEKDGIGALYPEIKEGNKIIIKFEYKRHEIANTVDGQYSELIYLELDPEDLEVDLEDTALKNVNALFGRLCFCRGQTGYYTINQGHLLIQKLAANQYQLSLSFKIENVPQVIKWIDEIIEIK